VVVAAPSSATPSTESSSVVVVAVVVVQTPQDPSCFIRLLYCTCLFLGFVRRTACIIILFVLFLVPINSPRRTRRTDLTRWLLQTDLTFVASRPLSFLSSFRSLPCRNRRVRWLTGHRTSLITRVGESKPNVAEDERRANRAKRQRLNL